MEGLINVNVQARACAQNANTCEFCLFRSTSDRLMSITLALSSEHSNPRFDTS